MSGSELKKLLLENNFTLSGTARLMGITKQDFNSKLGAQSLKADFIAKVEKVVNKTVDEMRKEKQGSGKPKKAPSGGKIDDVKSYTKEEIEEQIRLQATGGVSLLDEFSLRVIGFTLWEAFLLDKLDKLDENVDDKVMYCKRYAESYYRIRLRERFSQPTAEG